jgi:hypothetical protein
VSLRSNAQSNVSKVAEEFGGGGHAVPPAARSREVLTRPFQPLSKPCCAAFRRGKVSTVSHLSGLLLLDKPAGMSSTELSPFPLTQRRQVGHPEPLYDAKGMLQLLLA